MSLKHGKMFTYGKNQLKIKKRSSMSGQFYKQGTQ